MHALTLRPPIGGHVRRAMRRHLIYVVAVVVMGCPSKLLAPHLTPGPDVTGTWSGSTAGVMLSVALDSSSCEFGCGGSVNGGAYSDSATNVHGTFADLAGGSYYMTPPGSSLYSSPLPRMDHLHHAGRHDTPQHRHLLQGHVLDCDGDRGLRQVHERRGNRLGHAHAD